MIHDGVQIMAGHTDDGVLDELCGSVARLVRAAGAQPVLLRVQLGSASVELQWPERAAPPAPPSPVSEPDKGDTFHVCAPMVGTFYYAPEPGAAPYVRAGDMITAGQQVGVLEAMKLFNPVHVNQPGRVVEVLVADGSSVEYGQPLIACSVEVAD
jgi:acetyl-CoA carboxylase biotin carboxyl carrier protein